MGQPIYTAYTGGTITGCNTDENCSKIFAGATCGPQGLCGFNFPKTASMVQRLIRPLRHLSGAAMFS
ncbi:hypothetical protein TELCIR_07712 [Teladorsagia circumcincta]|uniref:Uncharacterized protein n=1 Tax=Teladorsagia circumcincta TaxID=45464 RepID=A0A2G9UJK8_TELCI|nr:hypothetical protein TELCIR_07712 [Teladorsagia circumcincta]